jgi:pimeloyl-ACP methyl ester carboxylesterase
MPGGRSVQLPTPNEHCAVSGLNVLRIDAHTPDAAGTTIVLVHGLATNMAFWYAGVANRLAAVGNVILFDLKGHGRSAMPLTGYTADVMAQDLIAVLDHFEVRCAHIAGHSYGGLVALEFALQYPERTQSLILADTRFPAVQRQLSVGSSAIGRDLCLRLSKVGVEIPDDCTDFGFELLTKMARLRASGDPRAAFIEEQFVGAYRMMGPRTAKQWLELLQSTDALAQFKMGSALTLPDMQRMKRPSCALYGALSMTLPSGEALSTVLPGCHFEVVPGVGHFFPASRPHEFVVRASRFLEESTDILPDSRPADVADSIATAAVTLA